MLLKFTRSVVRRYDLMLLALATAMLFLWPQLRANLFATTFGSEMFMPHTACYLQIPSLIRLHLISDMLIGCSYVAISGTLAYLVYRARRDIPFHWIFLAFGMFIVACGMTHFMEVLTLWKPTFWLSGYIKLVTAIASVATAVILPPLVPKTLALVQTAKLSEERRIGLEQANEELDALRKSEQERMLEALHASEERYRVVTDAASDAIISIDENSVIQFANHATERVFGYTVAELSGKQITMLMPDYLRHVHEVGIKRYLETGKRHLAWERIEVPGLRKSGKEFPLEISFGEFTRDGKHFFTGVVRDVTERKRAERYLAAQHAATRVLAESATLPDAAPKILQTVCESLGWEIGALWIVDHQVDVLRCANFWHAPLTAVPEFASLSEEYIISRGMGLPGRVWESAEPAWITDVTKNDNSMRADVAAKEGLHGGFAFPILLRGEVFGVIEFFSREIQPPDQELLDMISTVGSQVGQFIEHRQAAVDLQASEERYRTLADSMPQIVWTANPDGSLDYYNQQWIDYTGMTLEQTLGWGWQPVLHPDDLEECLKRWSRAVETGESYETEYRFKRASDGAYRWHLGRATPALDEDGRITKWYGACTDIEEQKRTEQALQDNQRQVQKLNAELELRVIERTAELAAANKELEAFSYSVSHDLRAPLRSIDGFSQALLEDYAESIDAQGQNYLQRVRAASQRMAQLIDDMLNLARVSRGDMRREQIDLSRMVREVSEQLHREEPERAVEVIIADNINARGDARLLRIALENLLGNAWKFTSKQRSARIEFGVREGDAGEDVFFVSDDGAGFDMAYSDKLFGAFQRLHSASEFEGTGIGLATVQRIIHRHGGRIRAESEVDRGATFYFTL